MGKILPVLTVLDQQQHNRTCLHTFLRTKQHVFNVKLYAPVPPKE